MAIPITVKVNVKNSTHKQKLGRQAYNNCKQDQWAWLVTFEKCLFFSFFSP